MFSWPGQRDRQTDWQKESLQRIAWLSLAFCFWHAIERHLAPALQTVCSLHSLSLSARPKCYSPRRALRIRRVLQQQQQLVETALHRLTHTHTHTQWGTKYVYVYVIHQAARVRLIKPANSASLGDLLQRFIRSLSVLHFALNFPIARNYVCLYIYVS